MLSEEKETNSSKGIRSMTGISFDVFLHHTILSIARFSNSCQRTRRESHFAGDDDVLSQFAGDDDVLSQLSPHALTTSQDLSSRLCERQQEFFQDERGNWKRRRCEGEQQRRRGERRRRRRRRNFNFNFGANNNQPLCVGGG